MTNFIYVALILISIGLIAAVTLQAKGSGLGGLLGGGDTVYKSRRGAEKTLFQATIVFAVIFVLLDLAAVLLQN